MPSKSTYITGHGVTSVGISPEWENTSTAVQATCRRCGGQFARLFYTKNLSTRPRASDCSECLGTNRDPIPWTELFIRAPFKRMD